MSRSNQLAGLLTADPPSALDTINEINTALGNDASLSTTLTNSIATKMPLAGGAFTGNVTTTGSIAVDDIIEKTSAHGVEIDGVTLKDGGGTFTDSTNHIYITARGTGDNTNLDVLSLENDDYEHSQTGQAVSQIFRLNRAGAMRTAGSIKAGKDSNWGDSANADGFLAFSTAENETVTERMRINSSGKVGIGTASPSQKLEISDSDTVGMQIRNLTNSGYSQLIFGTGSSSSSFCTIRHERVGADQGKLHITKPNDGSGGNAFTIDHTGKVGIAKTDPQDELHIVGTARISNDNVNSHATNAGTALEVRGPSIPSAGVDYDYFKGFKIALNDATEYGGQAQFSVGRWEENGSDARSTLMISLGHGGQNSSSDADTDVLQLFSDGSVTSHGNINAGAVGNSGDISKNTLFLSYNWADASTSQFEWLNRSIQNISGGGSGGAWCQIRASQSAYQTAMHMWFYRQWTGEEEFRFPYTGNATAEGSWGTGSLDFAELFEWADGNPKNEDRVGLPVVNIEGKIRVATNEDQPADIIGCISGVAGFIGNSASLHWKDKFITDDYGRVVEEDAHAFIWTDDKGEEHQYAHDEIPEGITVPEDAERVEGKRKKVNPDFDPSIEYIPRDERKEWGTVGLIGQVPVKKGSPVNPNWIKLKECSTKSDWYLIR